MMDKENILLTNKHVLVCIEEKVTGMNQNYLQDIDFIKKNFCGIVVSSEVELNEQKFSPNTIIYIIGDIEKSYDCIQDKQNKIFYVVKEVSRNFEEPSGKYSLITIGEVPINIHNVGIYFRNCFNTNANKDYFDLINKEHEFQLLRESNKVTNAYRKGIYLTAVEKDENDVLKFNLLRCSTNLDGPSDNFKRTDYEVINKVNNLCKPFFEEEVEMNHVLAQIYQNALVNGNLERKAKIKEHSDKTKDMPRNGLIAFCTFYKEYSNGKFNGDELKLIKKANADDFYDYCYNKTSVLTILRFRLKDSIKNPSYTKQFDVTLYPNSVFVISLHTNRLYTHEIVPSGLPIDKIPTRLGYVIRCSKTKAIFRNDQTYIVENNDKYIKLEQVTKENAKELKNIYFRENVTDDMINYDSIYFSLNDGDYKKPNI
jgi:uncharacterized C2H2 Zn-finger protein